MRGMTPAAPDRRQASVGATWPVALRDAAIVVAVCAAVAVILNGLRSDGIPLLQKEEYQILVPCPETTGETAAAPPNTARLLDSHVLIIDARSAREFGNWHLPRAINIPFDYLEPTPHDVIRRTASSGAREVLVYGDGSDPDSGEQLARELAGKGIRNMSFVSGGAPAILATKQQGATP